MNLTFSLYLSEVIDYLDLSVQIFVLVISRLFENYKHILKSKFRYEPKCLPKVSESLEKVREELWFLEAKKCMFVKYDKIFVLKHFVNEKLVERDVWVFHWFIASWIQNIYSFWISLDSSVLWFYDLVKNNFF